jgi:hypothetical protein
MKKTLLGSIALVILAISLGGCFAELSKDRLQSCYARPDCNPRVTVYGHPNNLAPHR